ncbi:MAG: hypothetical protein ACXABZ_09675 [Candidatus Thorarchaeota archaeon]
MKTSTDLPVTNCGKASCITVYKTTNCHFCDVAEKILRTSTEAQGVPQDVIHGILADSNTSIVSEENLSMAPVIEICERTLTGIPQEDNARNAMSEIIQKDCFLNYVNSKRKWMSRFSND